MGEQNLEDLFIVTLARALHDGERVFVGANQIDVALAAYLARRLWAPKLRIWAAGAAQIDPTQDRFVVGRRTNDNLMVAARGASFPQARAFDDVRSPVVFAGGLQVDGRGNANLAGVRDHAGGWMVRGPGSAGLPSLTALSPRFFLMVPRHERRTLVEQCSAISVVGDPPVRAALGLKADALVGVITPLATFCPSNDGLLLTGIAPGVTRGRLDASTGFVIREAAEVLERLPVAPEESAALSDLRAAMDENRRAGRERVAVR